MLWFVLAGRTEPCSGLSGGAPAGRISDALSAPIKWHIQAECQCAVQDCLDQGFRGYGKDALW